MHNSASCAKRSDRRQPTLPDRCFSFLSGLPRAGRQPRRRSKPGLAAGGIVLLWISIASGIAVVNGMGEAGLPLLLISDAVAVSAARYVQLCIMHHAAHGNVLGGGKDVALGRFIATMLMIERFDSYAQRHVVAHHGPQSLSTRTDDTVGFLLETLRIVPGNSVEANLRRFLWALVSPRVHWTMLCRRLHSQFISGSWANRAVATIYLASALWITFATQAWLAVICAVVVPLTVGYQVAQCARLSVEHHWPGTAGHRGPRQHDALTVAVRCIPPAPERSNMGSLLRWYLDLAFNALIRCLVLPGDSGPSHAWHHGRPRGDWANHVIEAAAWDEWRRANGRGATPEVWGYRAALRLALESFSRASEESLAPPRSQAATRSTP